MTAGFLVTRGEGDAVWSIGGRFTRKVGGADSDSRLSILPGLSLPRREVILPIAERYGIEIVGPPIRQETR